jgi:hypothetical protein
MVYYNFGRIFVAFALLVGVTHANDIEEMSLSQKVENSDLVVIGEIVSIKQRCLIPGNKCAEIHILVRLKGIGGDVNPSIIFDGMVAELDPLCCELQSKYIFFLKKIDGNIYRSVNGPFGVYLIPQNVGEKGAGTIPNRATFQKGSTVVSGATNDVAKSDDYRGAGVMTQ